MVESLDRKKSNEMKIMTSLHVNFVGQYRALDLKLRLEHEVRSP
jgi:hypothetical protein